MPDCGKCSGRCCREQAQVYLSPEDVRWVQDNAPQVEVVRFGSIGYIPTLGEACPFVGESGRCVIYADRPLICRPFPLNIVAAPGVPLTWDVSWCWQHDPGAAFGAGTAISFQGALDAFKMPWAEFQHLAAMWALNQLRTLDAERSIPLKVLNRARRFKARNAARVPGSPAFAAFRPELNAAFFQMLMAAAGHAYARVKQEGFATTAELVAKFEALFPRAMAHAEMSVLEQLKRGPPGHLGGGGQPAEGGA